MVQLIGNVVKDATAKKVSADKVVINFTIALNHRFVKEGGEVVSQPTFIDCEYWINSEVYKYITKGRLVEVFGRIYPHAYQNAKGEIKGTIRCNVNSIELHSSKGTDQTNQETDGDTSSNKDEVEPVTVLETADDLPF
ncbi:MAG: single-stranded DNA-binding protein [Chitinophagaceae bacterium]